MSIRSFFIIAAIVCAPTTTQAQADSRLPDSAFRQRLESWLAPVGERELSGTLLVARGDRIILERSWGYANHEHRVPFTPSTPTAIASLTKPLTRIIASQLMDQKLLSPRDTVSKWLPEFAHGARMTVGQLIDHSAGVPHRLLAESDQNEPRTAADMVRFASDMKLLFEPGDSSVYSSGGYAILAAVLERASRRSYDELLQEYVARPVSAGTVRHVDSRTLLRGRASSAIPAGDTVINTPLRDLSFLVGGGSAYATPRSIHRVILGLLAGRYGASARLDLVRPNGIHWNGVTNGYRAIADWYPGDSLTVLYFGNLHTGAIDLMRRAIPRMSAGDTAAPPRVAPVRPMRLTAEQMRRIEGDYDTGGGAVARVKFVSSSIALFGDRALIAVDDSTFFSTADYARVIFVSESAGEVTGIRWGAGTWGTGQEGPRFARVRSR